MVLEDWLTNPLWVAVLRTCLFLLWGSGLVIAIYVILAS